jgi:starch phosphorylase
MNVPFEQFLELGRDEQNPHVFSMTVLALNISSKSNAVAQLHGDVAYEMWKHVLPKDDPNHLGYVTNGVHLGSWLGDSIKEIYSQEMERG